MSSSGDKPGKSNRSTHCTALLSADNETVAIMVKEATFAATPQIIMIMYMYTNTDSELSMIALADEMERKGQPAALHYCSTVLAAMYTGFNNTIVATTLELNNL